MIKWRSDVGENSIMQTISIVVSAILIAAGMITAPNILNQAKDNNARVDIANLAFAEESVMANIGKYLTGFDSTLPGSLVAESGVRVNLSGNVEDHAVVVCDAPQSYLIKATSASGTTFYRSSFSGTVSSDISRIVIPPCVAPEFYSGIPAEEIPVEETPDDAEEEPPVDEEEPPAEDPTPTEPAGYDDSSPLITISPATASVTYTVVANSYNVLQIKLNNVTLTNNADSKQDWEIRINKLAYPLNRFASVSTISAEDSRVNCTDHATYYSCVNNQTGPWGNGISSTNSFSLGIVVNATLAYVDNVAVSQASPTGGAWYATQAVTVSTTYPVYGYWKTRIDFTALKSLGTSAPYLCINDSNVTITHDTGNWYWVEGNSDYYTIKADAPRTFTAAKSTGNGGGCTNL